MLKVDVRVKTCQVCEKEISLREALEVAAGIPDMATIDRIAKICTDKDNEATKITELDVYDDDAHITDKVFYPITLSFTDTPVVCKECLGIHKPSWAEICRRECIDHSPDYGQRYIDEAESQGGSEYWDVFKELYHVTDDLDLYIDAITNAGPAVKSKK